MPSYTRTRESGTCTGYAGWAKRGNHTPDEDMEEDDALIEGIYEEESIPFAGQSDIRQYQLEELLAITSTSS